WVTAGKHYEESLVVSRELLVANPERPQAKQDLANVLERMGMVLLESENVKPAAAVLGESLSFAQQLSLAEPDSRKYKLLYSETLTLLAATDPSRTEGGHTRRMAWDIIAKIPRPLVRQWWDSARIYEHLRREFAADVPICIATPRPPFIAPLGCDRRVP
ncbi:MAG: hypothetical protein ACKO3P_01830, partial [Planctomycetaceae bacterium]